MKKYHIKNLNDFQLKSLCKRKAIQLDNVFPLVQEIISQVKIRGDRALKDYTKQFDNVNLSSFLVTQKEIKETCKKIPKDVQIAFKKSYSNIKRFHKAQLRKYKAVKTMPGILCFPQLRPIEKVGFYIPGGTAPLPSTVLMLAIPAKLAGCKDITLVTPPNSNGTIPDVILYAAKLCGVNKVFKLGGAQAIAALAYGTESIAKVYKIFGPGNQYVTASKMLVSSDPEGATIDMPAGPTEALVIADKNAKASFVASDLLAQAEHSIDAQIVLICTNKSKTMEILGQVKQQLKTLPRKKIAQQSLKNSFALIVNSIEEAINFSNTYAPEHLVLNIRAAKKYVQKIINAGSVFLGQYSCESAGDYASGTNHVLPTYGLACAYSGISVDSFQKQITFQEVTAQGAKILGPIVEKMAEQEYLYGHKRAMELRYKS